VSQDISLEEVIRTIVSQTGLSREEIRKKIDATIASFDGLLTEVGAALIIGDKLGVKVNAHQADPGSQGDSSGMDSALKIKDVIEGTKKNTSLKNIIVFGRVASITPPREFQKKDGRKGAVAAITLKDATGQIRVSCWDQKANLVDSSIKQGAIIGIINAYTKIGRDGDVEVHVDNRGTLKPKPDDLDESTFPAAEPISATSSSSVIGTIKSVPESATFTSFTAKVQEKFPPKTFTKKDGSEGSVARVRVVDESGSTFVVFWADRMEDYNGLNAGEAYQFEGLAVKKNTFGNNTTLEFHANRASKITKSTKKIDAKLDTPGSGTAPGPSAPAVATTIANVKEDAVFCTLTAKVQEKLPPKTFTKKDGSEGSVARVRIADESSTAFVVFWADRMEDYNSLNAGEAYQFEGFAVKKNTFGNNTTLEFHANRASKITKSAQKIEIKVKKLKIGEVTETQLPISIEGRVKAIDEERQITLKDGTQTRNIKILIADETGSINMVAWREAVDDIKKFKPSDPIKVENVTAVKSRFNNDEMEIKIGKETRITKPQKSQVPAIETVAADKAFQRQKSALPTGPVQRLSLDHVEDNMAGEIIARVINVSRYINNYMACPKCKKKVTLQNDVYTCVNDGKQPGASPRLIAKMTVDDGFGKINVAMIGDSVVKFFGISEKEKMKLAEKEEPGGLRTEKDEILEKVNNRVLLKSFAFRGKVKLNDYQKELEIIADNATEVDLNKETSIIVKEIESAS
jgi:ssDNA-binding replication factor A large subunit